MTFDSYIIYYLYVCASLTASSDEKAAIDWLNGIYYTFGRTWYCYTVIHDKKNHSIVRGCLCLVHQTLYLCVIRTTCTVDFIGFMCSRLNWSTDSNLAQQIITKYFSILSIWTPEIDWYFGTCLLITLACGWDGTEPLQSSSIAIPTVILGTHSQRPHSWQLRSTRTHAFDSGCKVCSEKVAKKGKCSFHWRRSSSKAVLPRPHLRNIATNLTSAQFLWRKPPSGKPKLCVRAENYTYHRSPNDARAATKRYG